MNRDEPRQILFAEVLLNGMVITFVDGTCALYSAELLHHILPQAVVLNDEQCRQVH